MNQTRYWYHLGAPNETYFLLRVHPHTEKLYFTSNNTNSLNMKQRIIFFTLKKKLFIESVTIFLYQKEIFDLLQRREFCILVKLFFEFKKKTVLVSKNRILHTGHRVSTKLMKRFTLLAKLV